MAVSVTLGMQERYLRVRCGLRYKEEHLLRVQGLLIGTLVLFVCSILWQCPSPPRVIPVVNLFGGIKLTKYVEKRFITFLTTHLRFY